MGGSQSRRHGSLGAEAASMVVIMLMASVEPEPVTLGGKQELLKVHLSLCAISLKARDTCSWHLLSDFILCSYGEHCSIKAQTPCRPNKFQESQCIGGGSRVQRFGLCTPETPCLDLNLSLWLHWSCELRQETLPLCFPSLISKVRVIVIPLPRRH